MQQSAASSSSRDHQTDSAAQPSAAEISLSTAQNRRLCTLLTSCLREKYQTGATQSLRSLVNTARRLTEPGYTYAQAARVVRHSLREGQPRYVWTCKNEGTDQEDLMFNLTSETMVSRRNKHRLPALQPAPPAALQMAPSEPHMQPAAAPSLQPTHLATPPDPQPDLVEHHTHINNFLHQHPGQWYQLAVLEPKLVDEEIATLGAACIAAGASCYWDDSSVADSWPKGCYLRWNRPKVWTADRQHTYHVRPDCGQLPSGAPKERELCMICGDFYIPGTQTVYTTADGPNFHIDQQCGGLRNANAKEPRTQCGTCAP